MTATNFKDKVEQGLGCIVILAGSGSDEPHIKKIADSLGQYEIPFEVRIVSAHKQPNMLMEIIKIYDLMKGPLAYVAVAGGTDALSGMVSYHSNRPTISCPPDAPNQSCLTNPTGSSNCYITNPKNVGRFIAQMFSYTNPNYIIILEKDKTEKLESLILDDKKLIEKFRVKNANQ